MQNTKWILDPTHSELGFKIKHLMITNVSGSFKDFQVVVDTKNEDFSTAQILATIEMASIFTNNTQRDEHLRNSDFFSVSEFPQLTFKSTGVEIIDGENFEVTGDLTMKGITKPVTLNVEYSGVTKDPWGGERVGFVVTGKIKRSEWGVSFNGLLESGGMMLGEEVKLHSEIQLVKQVEEVLV
jgi:polyisoprenoid-binding protein YceI